MAHPEEVNKNRLPLIPSKIKQLWRNVKNIWAGEPDEVKNPGRRKLMGDLAAVVGLTAAGGTGLGLLAREIGRGANQADSVEVDDEFNKDKTTYREVKERLVSLLFALREKIFLEIPARMNVGVTVDYGEYRGISNILYVYRHADGRFTVESEAYRREYEATLAQALGALDYMERNRQGGRGPNPLNIYAPIRVRITPPDSWVEQQLTELGLDSHIEQVKTTINELILTSINEAVEEFDTTGNILNAGLGYQIQSQLFSMKPSLQAEVSPGIENEIIRRELQSLPDSVFLEWIVNALREMASASPFTIQPDQLYDIDFRIKGDDTVLVGVDNEYPRLGWNFSKEGAISNITGRGSFDLLGTEGGQLYLNFQFVVHISTDSFNFNEVVKEWLKSQYTSLSYSFGVAVPIVMSLTEKERLSGNLQAVVASRRDLQSRLVQTLDSSEQHFLPLPQNRDTV